MNQRQLQYFLKVYETKNISKAAEILFISPQALSKTIAKLESELGVELFFHKANRIIPTAAATRLASHANNILMEYDIIENSLFKNAPSKKTVKVSCSFDIPQMISADFFFFFCQEHPEILIQIHEYSDTLILEQLEHADIEIAILGSPLNHAVFEFTPLFSEPFCLVMNKNHPLAEKEQIHPSDLKGLPLVIKDMYSPISITQFAEFQKSHSLPDVILETSDSHLIHAMAEKDGTLGMTLHYLAQRIQNGQIIIRPFENDCFIKTFYLAKHKGYPLSKEAELIYQTLRSFFLSE